jgi:hypothetical protein
LVSREKKSDPESEVKQTVLRNAQKNLIRNMVFETGSITTLQVKRMPISVLADV